MRRLFGPFVAAPGAVGLLVLRLIAGAALMQHGWPKIQNPFGWMDPFHPGVPGLLQALSAVAEFGGGLAFILGLLTPIAAAGVVVNMAVAAGMVHIPHHDPFVNATGGPSYEPALLYLGIALTFMLVGPGSFSLDRLLFGMSARREAAEDPGIPVRPTDRAIS